MNWAADLSQYYFRYTEGMNQVIQVSLIEKNAFIHHPDRMYQTQTTKQVSMDFESRMPLHHFKYVPKQQEWFGLPGDPIDPIRFVARSGGYRYGDSYDVFPEIKPDLAGNYHFYFLPLDPWKTEPVIHEHILQLQLQQRLQIDAGKLKDGEIQLGKLPGYLSVMAQTCPEAVSIEVAKVNHKSPDYYSLLCHATVNGQLLTPFAGEEYLTCMPF